MLRQLTQIVKRSWMLQLGGRTGRLISFLVFLGLIISLGLVLHLTLASLQLKAKSPSLAPTGASAKQGELPQRDVVVVFDTTGSMEFDTICYGCWARCGDTGAGNGTLIPAGICPTSVADRGKYRRYPGNGWAFPYTYTSTLMQTLIYSNSGRPQPEGSNNYIILEAEFYSNNLSNWAPAFRTAGQGYWAIQRNKEAKAYSIDGYGESYGGTTGDKLSGLVRHHPYIEINGAPFGKNYTLAEAQAGIAPRLDYNFYPTWAGNTYIYLRAQYFNETGNSTPRNQFFWAVDDNLAVAATGGGQNNSPWYADNSWSWVKLGPVSLTQNLTHTLKIWAGSPGYALDRIIITSQNVDMNTNPLRNLRATAGSAQRLAGDPCNPIFGLTVQPGDCTYLTLFEPVNNLNDPLFDGLNPIRGAQEATRAFIAGLNPEQTQVGLTSFASNGTQRAQLECLRASQGRADSSPPQKDNYPLVSNTGVYSEYDELNCFNTAAGTTPISFTNLFIGIENVYPPVGDTDIADGLRRGLHMLGITTDNDGTQNNDCTWSWVSPNWLIGGVPQPGLGNPATHCGRGPAAQPVMVLLTDGPPNNSTPGDNADCTTWGENNPPPYEGFPGSPSNPQPEFEQNKYECVMYYADIAANNDVSICTIGLGVGADQELLQAVATQTNGHAYTVFSSAQLDTVFEAVLNDCIRADLTITKTAPATATAYSPITYTLTVTNHTPITLTDLLITDTIPPGATYLSGGTKVGQVVSWTIPSLAAQGGVTQTVFVVTATTTLTNSDYRVSASGGYSAVGGLPIVTQISDLPTPGPKVYLPVILSELK